MTSKDLPLSWRNADISWACASLKENTPYDGAAIEREWNEMKRICLAAEQTPDWAECLRISELPAVDDAIRNLLADQTEDNAVCMVRAIIEQVSNKDAVDAQRWRFSMDWQDTPKWTKHPEAINDMWRKVIARGSLKPTRAEYEAATDAAIVEAREKS